MLESERGDSILRDGELPDLEVELDLAGGVRGGRRRRRGLPPRHCHADAGAAHLDP